MSAVLFWAAWTRMPDGRYRDERLGDVLLAHGDVAYLVYLATKRRDEHVGLAASVLLSDLCQRSGLDDGALDRCEPDLAEDLLGVAIAGGGGWAQAE